jgi:uncharacterized peroxidase-related enzyme
MSRLNAIDPTTVTGRAKELLDAVKGKLGIVPNMTRVMANSPAVLEGYLGLSGALAGGSLSAKTREELALVVAQENGCDYCLSAHTAIGKMTGLSTEQMLKSRRGEGETESVTAALHFAQRMLETRGAVTPEDLTAARAAGLSDGEIAEVVAHVALNVFTNYFNLAAGVEIDFPRVSSGDLH